MVAALGVGFAYVTPIAMCIKWFPDKRGMIVGLAVMGFGVGPLLFGPLLETLIGKDPARLSETIPRTFLVLAAIAGWANDARPSVSEAASDVIFIRSPLQ